MQAVRILPGREICSAVLWLLCKVLFNDTATEGVLYDLSHCSSLQSRHCVSTLLFYIYKQQVIPEKFLFQLNRPQLCHYLTLLGQVLLLQLQRVPASCPGRLQLPSPGACTARRARELFLPRSKLSTMGQQRGCRHSPASLETLQGKGIVGTWLVLGSQWVQGEPGPINLSTLMQWDNLHSNQSADP